MTTWTYLKPILVAKNKHPQYIETSENYLIKAYDGAALIGECVINKSFNKDECVDFETNFKPLANTTVIQEAVNQLEKDDKDLKLAKNYATVDPVTKKAILSIKVPGTLGNMAARSILGGYIFTNEYREDDYCICYVEDTDRVLAMQAALEADPDAVAPLDDSTMQAVSPYPLYPILKCYYDEEQPVANQGWYTWPVIKDGTSNPIGECEVEPIGGFGSLPAGFYLVVELIRSVGTGHARCNYYWGKKNA